MRARERFTPAVKMGISLSIATGLYGISFGALGVAAGLDRIQTQLLSAIMFTGGSQFAFIGMLGGGGGAATTAAALLGIRNAVYSATLKASLRPSGILIPAMAQVTIDESFAVASGQTDHAERVRGFWTTGIGVFVMWNLFTFLGAWLGAALGIAFATKLVGYLLPATWLESETFTRISAALTVGLLAALVASNTLADGAQVSLDSRILAIIGAGIALWRRARFIVVVIIGAACAALGRLAGLP